MAFKEPSELDFCMDALVNLAGYPQENLVKFLKAFPEQEAGTREVLERIIINLELDYQPEQKVDDFYATAVYLQQQGHQEEAKSLYKAIIKRTAPRWDDYYKRIM